MPLATGIRTSISQMLLCCGSSPWRSSPRTSKGGERYWSLSYGTLPSGDAPTTWSLWRSTQRRSSWHVVRTNLCRNTAPMVARITFGSNGSILPPNRMKPAPLTAAHVLTRHPRFPDDRNLLSTTQHPQCAGRHRAHILVLVLQSGSKRVDVSGVDDLKL